MGCRANRVTVTYEAAQLLCRLRPRHICISAVPSPVLAPPLHSSRLHVAPVQTAREGCFSVNGVTSPILRAALTYFHDGTRTAGAGMKPKPFAAHLQTFYAFRSNPRGAVLHRLSSKSGEGKLSVPSPPIISFPVCVPQTHISFFFFCTRMVSVCSRCSVSTRHAGNLLSSRGQTWPFHSGKCHFVSVAEEI